eukprot:11094316-Ditylum_brightwellii.AAC.1
MVFVVNTMNLTDVTQPSFIIERGVGGSDSGGISNKKDIPLVVETAYFVAAFGNHRETIFSCHFAMKQNLFFPSNILLLLAAQSKTN